MNYPEKIKSPFTQLQHYVWVLSVIWTIVIAVSLVWSIIQEKKEILEVARSQAKTDCEGDIIYRQWNAMHGGVYVPVTKETQPNPYLSNIPERDIKTPSGKLLTLMNPAYMTRQVHELQEKRHGIKGHVTSLNPIRPENAPDPWEAKALKAFERGATEVSSVEKIEGKEYMRMMRPLITEKRCLQCHASQGYKEGDIRGGISTSIPMDYFFALVHSQVLMFVLSRFFLWLFGIVGIVFGMQRLRRSERERNQAEEEIKKLNENLLRRTAELEALNKELEAFSYSVSHDLRAPLRSIDGFSQALLEDYAGKLDKGGKEYFQRVRGASQRMGQLIDDLLNLSRVTRRELRYNNVNLSEMAQAVSEELQMSQPERKVEFVIVPGLITNGDERLLRVLLENLLGNAFKFTEKVLHARIEFGSTQHEGKQTYYVRDNGAGFDMKYADKLFGAFQRLHSQSEFPGTGIGLAIIQRIINRHGGRIWAEGEVDKGATFYFTLLKNDYGDKK